MLIFSLGTAFNVFYMFGHAMYSFSLNSRKSLIYFFISVLIQFSLCRELFSFHEFVSCLFVSKNVINLEMCHEVLRRRCTFCVWVKCSVDIYEVHLVYNIG